MRYLPAVNRQFFQNGKVLPIVRGAGVDQPIMHTAARQVRRKGFTWWL